MQRRQYYGFIVGLMLIIVVGCGPSKFTTGATPQVAAEQKVLQYTPPGEPRGFTALHTQQFEDFAVVLYSKPGSDVERELYYQIVHHDQTEWYTKECCDGGGGTLTTVVGLDDLVRVQTSNSVEPRFVYGHAVSPEVSAVEVRFDTGERVADQIEDKFFLVLSEEGRNICTIRLLSAQNTTLAETQLSNAEGCS